MIDSLMIAIEIMYMIQAVCPSIVFLKVHKILSLDVGGSKEQITFSVRS